MCSLSALSVANRLVCNNLSVLTEVRPVHGPAVSLVCCLSLEPFMALVRTPVWLMDDFWPPANQKRADFKQGLNFLPWTSYCAWTLLFPTWTAVAKLRDGDRIFSWGASAEKILIVSRREVGLAVMLSVVLWVCTSRRLCARLVGSCVVFLQAVVENLTTNLINEFFFSVYLIISQSPVSKRQLTSSGLLSWLLQPFLILSVAEGCFGHMSLPANLRCGIDVCLFFLWGFSLVVKILAGNNKWEDHRVISPSWFCG